MFGIGMPELMLVLALALIVIGPKKLPDIAKALGRGLAEFKRATEDLKNQIEVESRVSETRERLIKEGKIKAPGSEEGSETEGEPPAEAEEAPGSPPAAPADSGEMQDEVQGEAQKSASAGAGPGDDEASQEENSSREEPRQKEPGHGG